MWLVVLVAGLFFVIAMVALVIWFTGNSSENEDAPEPVSAIPGSAERVCVVPEVGRNFRILVESRDA